jgi:hypothetical protein
VGADATIKDYSGKTAIEMIYKDECISYLFAGGKTSGKSVACAPPQRSSVSFPASGLIH